MSRINLIGPHISRVGECLQRRPVSQPSFVAFITALESYEKSLTSARIESLRLGPLISILHYFNERVGPRDNVEDHILEGACVLLQRANLIPQDGESLFTFHSRFSRLVEGHNGVLPITLVYGSHRVDDPHYEVDDQHLGEGLEGVVETVSLSAIEATFARKAYHKSYGGIDGLSCFLNETRFQLRPDAHRYGLAQIYDWGLLEHGIPHDWGVLVGGIPYHIVELLDERSLGGFSKKLTAYPFIYRQPEPLVAELVKITRPLAALHRRGIIHRDIKGANILRAENGDYWIIDSGMACLRSEVEGIPAHKHLWGTYWPPESLSEGYYVSENTDVYAMGIALSELVIVDRINHSPSDKGQIKFGEELRKRLKDQNQTRGLQSGLIGILKKAIDANPSQRFKDGVELHQAMRELERSLA